MSNYNQYSWPQRPHNGRYQSQAPRPPRTYQYPGPHQRSNFVRYRPSPYHSRLNFHPSHPPPHFLHHRRPQFHQPNPPPAPTLFPTPPPSSSSSNSSNCPSPSSQSETDSLPGYFTTPQPSSSYSPTSFEYPPAIPMQPFTSWESTQPKKPQPTVVTREKLFQVVGFLAKLNKELACRPATKKDDEATEDEKKKTIKCSDRSVPFRESKEWLDSLATLPQVIAKLHEGVLCESCGRRFDDQLAAHPCDSDEHAATRRARGWMNSLTEWIGLP